LKSPQETIKVAQSIGSSEKATFYLCALGRIQRKRGNLVEAMQTCEQAAQSSLGARRISRLEAFECMRSWGKWEDALEMLKQAQSAPAFPVPATERRSQALISLGRSWIYAEQGKSEEALECLSGPAKELMREEKIGLLCVGTEAWVLATLDRREEAREKMQEALQRAPGLAGNRSTQLSCINYLGRATFEMSDYSESLNYWDRYLTLKPDPVDLPKVHFYRGECLWELGETDPALTSYLNALDSGIETLYTDKARKKLASLAPALPVQSS
jgi:tetratricopeptide (TPR) repeat protein